MDRKGFRIYPEDVIEINHKIYIDVESLEIYLTKRLEENVPCPSPTKLEENSQLRWFFIGKLYSIITFLFFLIALVISVTVFSPSVANFFNNTTQGFHLYIALNSVPFITIYPLYYYDKKYPLNYFLLLIFIVSSAIAMGLTCAFASGWKWWEGLKTLQSAIFLTAMMFSMTLYTFWAAKRGHNFNILGSFLFKSLLVFLIVGFGQFLFPLWRFGYMLILCFLSIFGFGCILFLTSEFIKSFTYDQHIRAFLCLYPCFITVFVL